MTETDPAERVATPCPSCSPEVPTAHEVLTTGGGQATVRCTACSHVHKRRLADETETEVPVVVSQDGDSFRTTVEAPREETIARGEEFVVETDEAIMEVRITDLQVGAEQRTAEAPVRDVETIWTRGVGNVGVDVTINPADGGREGTESKRVYVPGDYEFSVGDVEAFGDAEFRVKSLLLRDDARGYEFDQLDHEGDAAVAKDLDRVYGDDQTESAWSAW